MPGRAEADAAAHAGPTGHVLPAAPTPRVGAPGHRRRPRPARSRGAGPGWGPLHLLSAVPWPDTSPGGSSGTGRAPRAPEGVGQASLLPDSPHRPTAALCGMSGDASSRQRQERALPRGARPAHAGPGVLGAHRACRCPAPAPLPPPPTQPGAPAPTRDSGRNVGGARASLPHGTLALAGRTRPPAPSRPAPPNCCRRGGDPAAGCRPESRRGGASMGPHARTRTLLLTGTAPTSPTRALHAQRPSLLPLPPAVCARGLGPPPPPPAPGRGQQRGHLSTEDMSPAVPSASTHGIQPIGAVQRTELGSRLTAAEQRVPRELGAAGVQTSVSARPRSQRQCPRCPHFPEMPREQSLLANPRRLT